MLFGTAPDAFFSEVVVPVVGIVLLPVVVFLAVDGVVEGRGPAAERVTQLYASLDLLDVSGHFRPDLYLVAVAVCQLGFGISHKVLERKEEDALKCDGAKQYKSLSIYLVSHVVYLSHGYLYRELMHVFGVSVARLDLGLLELLHVRPVVENFALELSLL